MRRPLVQVELLRSSRKDPDVEEDGEIYEEVDEDDDDDVDETHTTNES